jgi:hypothetical protein
LTLLAFGLLVGILWAIPIYLLVRLACAMRQLKRKGKSLSRKQWPKLSPFLLGTASLATQNPIWFQLELTFILAVAPVAWLLGRVRLDELEFPSGKDLIGRVPSRFMNSVFIAGFVIIPAANLWLALYASETAWLLFRTLGLFAGAAGMGVLGTWLAARHAERNT